MAFLKTYVRSRFWRRFIRFFGLLFFLFALLFAYVGYVSRMTPPEVPQSALLNESRIEVDSGFFYLRNNWFHKSKSGLFEMYVEGNPFERGLANGKLSKELIIKQEEAFSDQINQMIPSHFYRQFLRYFIGFFNRNLDQNVPLEYKQEIYGESLSASHQFDDIGTNYERLMNYHAAHDIGHALQNMMLVGCTSFGTWNEASADSSLIIGRNFDFYVGDKFAEDKMVEFVRPTSGHPFMMITWGGFIGVASGMNQEGLTVTINAAKSPIPSGSATPISLVAREILQYASNIREAIQIAKKRKTFVSESILIGSANDNKAIIIEKTPDTLDVYDPGKQFIVCANHYQSKSLLNQEANLEQIAGSASPYRFNKVMELLQENGKNTVAKTVSILRDRSGLRNADIGMGNEKAINQLIAHHSVVFEPKQRKVWVSTAPWQLGPYICYDLNQVFSLAGLRQNREVWDSTFNIPADPFIYTPEFKQFLSFRKMKEDIRSGMTVDPDSIIQSNPNYYHSYVMAGDICFRKKEYEKALKYYQKGLTLEIATVKEKKHLENQIAAIHKLQLNQ